MDKTAKGDNDIPSKQRNHANGTLKETEEKKDSDLFDEEQQKLIDPQIIILGSWIKSMKSNNNNTSCKTTTIIDTCAFYIFGTLFLIFNGIYWIFWTPMLASDEET